MGHVCSVLCESPHHVDLFYAGCDLETLRDAYIGDFLFNRLVSRTYRIDRIEIATEAPGPVEGVTVHIASQTPWRPGTFGTLHPYLFWLTDVGPL